MTTNTRPRIRLSQGQHGHTRIQIGRYRAFVPRGLLRTLADRIHDHADALDRADREHGEPTSTALAADRVRSTVQNAHEVQQRASAGNASPAPPSMPATATAGHPTPRDEVDAANGAQSVAPPNTTGRENHQ